MTGCALISYESQHLFFYWLVSILTVIPFDDADTTIIITDAYPCS